MENLTACAPSNKNCEGMQKDIFGRWGGEKCAISNEVRSNVL
jgi:hypothetical protein